MEKTGWHGLERQAPGVGRLWLETSVTPAYPAELIAVLVAVTAGQPRILTVQAGCALPSGPFETGQRSLQSSLRAWVEQQTHHPLGYVEQLYTFADGGAAAGPLHRAISISYLGLTQEGPASGGYDASWQGWYDYFPWEDQRGEDHRTGPSPAVSALAPSLQAWADAARDPAAASDRRQRAAITFGLDGRGWNEELVLQRYELLYEVGLVPEAPQPQVRPQPRPAPGRSMMLDHRRVAATGIARLRAKIKYRPVVFELLPPEFTLLHLQRTVEGIAGRLIHKQNFRRLVEQQDLVEETGGMVAGTGGRPAKLFRFRREVLSERAVAGTKLPLSRP